MLEITEKKPILKKEGGEISGSRWKFPVFTGAESLFVNSIIDSAAGTSVIGEETLKEYFRLLHLKDLEKADPMESTHRFGYHGRPISAICLVFIRLPIKGHKILVRTGLLPGISFLHRSRNTRTYESRFELRRAQTIT